MQVTYTKRDTTTHTEDLEMTLVGVVEDQLDDIKVETVAESSRAIETLDKALEEVSTAQAKLGAIQNRLTHNIDNLSKGSMLTEQSVGRIVDADFATETSELSKQQILAQAATSMLAQANQSKQSVLALLQ
jgi:flagellin